MVLENSADAGHDALGQRRYLTVLFSDLSDSTRLGELMEAEYYAEMLGALRAPAARSFQARRSNCPHPGRRCVGDIWLPACARAAPRDRGGTGAPRGGEPARNQKRPRLGRLAGPALGYTRRTGFSRSWRLRARPLRSTGRGAEYCRAAVEPGRTGPDICQRRNLGTGGEFLRDQRAPPGEPQGAVLAAAGVLRTRASTGTKSFPGKIHARTRTLRRPD